MAINKVIYGGQTLIDITDTTALSDKVLGLLRRYSTLV